MCPICDDGFQQEQKLWEHAKGVHADALSVAESGNENEARKKFEKSASERAYVTIILMTSLPLEQPSCKPQIGFCAQNRSVVLMLLHDPDEKHPAG